MQRTAVPEHSATREPSGTTDYFDLLAQGTDFHCFQDCRDAGYEEYYFEPDCVLLFPGTRQAVVFDLNYLTVGRTPPSFARRFLPWDLCRKKMALIYPSNELSSAVYPVAETHRIRVMRVRQATRDVRFICGERYAPLCELTTGQPASAEALTALGAAWEARRKMKIQVRLGQCLLQFPIRIAYRQEGVYSFASKTVVIPEIYSTEFRWEETALGALSLATNGSCSVFRRHNSRWPVREVLAACWPGLAQFFLRVFAPSDHAREERVRANLRASCGPWLFHGLASFTVAEASYRWTILAADHAQPTAVAVPLHG